MSKSHSQIDPRGPRFGAAITSVLVLITFFLALDTSTSALAFSLFAYVWVAFLWGVLFGNAKHPYGWLFRKFVRPRLQAAKELEDSRPPRFAQLVGLFVASVGFALAFAGVESGIAIASAAVFMASFLNSAFNYCLGCKMYLGLRRIGIIRG
jgi:hypothetical protein